MGYASALGLVASGVGMGMKMSAEQTRRWKAQDAVKEELIRQYEYLQKGTNEIGENISSYKDVPGQMKHGTEKAEALYRDTESRPVSTSPPNKASETVVGGQKNAAWAGITNAAKAPLHGYDEFLLQQQIKNLRTAQALSQIAQNARTSQSIMPLKLAEASEAQKGRMEWGQLMSTIGMALGMAGGLSSATGLFSGAANAGSGLQGGYSGFNFTPVGADPNWSYAALMPTSL
jgi:hypothetical protein